MKDFARQAILRARQHVIKGEVRPPRANDAANEWFLREVDKAQGRAERSRDKD